MNDGRLRDIRHFADGSGMNLDDDARLLKPNEHREIWNSIISVSETSKRYCLEPIKGTLDVFAQAVNRSLDPADGLVSVGGCKDIERNAVVLFLCDPTGVNHSILRFYNATKACQWLLKNEPLLNFKENYPVTANIIDDLLYWTDGYYNSALDNDFNPPRKINMSKAAKYTEKVNEDLTFDFQQVKEAYAVTGIKTFEGMTAYMGSVAYQQQSSTVVTFALDGIMRNRNATGYGSALHYGFSNGMYYVVTDRPWWFDDTNAHDCEGHLLAYETGMYFGIDWQVLDVIKYPPEYEPLPEYISDSTKDTNRLRGSLFQFAYRYVYDDNERSVFSPISKVALPTSALTFSNDTGQSQTTDNCINVGIKTGSREVKSIEVAVRKNNTGSWQLLERIYKTYSDGDVSVGDDLDYTVVFYNDEALQPIDPSDAARVYDFVPLTAKQQDLIEKNRLIYADYTEGFDGVDIDVDMAVVTDYPQVGDIGERFTRKEPNTWKVQAVPPGSLTFFRYAVINLASFYEPGSTYIVNINAPSHTYTDEENVLAPGVTLAQVYGDYASKNIQAQAILTTTPETTLEQFSDALCVSLRNGNNQNDAVIACNTYGYQGFNTYTGFTILSGTYGTPWLTDEQLGIILTTTDTSNGASSVLSDLSVVITRVKTSSVLETLKSNETKNFGIMYFDRAMRFGAINSSSDTSLFVPAQTSADQTHPIARNLVSWSINHQPPDWAYYYSWAITRKTGIEYSLYATFSVIESVNTKNNSEQNVFICVNQYILDQNEETSSFGVSAYQWQRGDRIRFVANMNDDFDYNTIPAVLDFEILGTLDPSDSGDNSTYLKNDVGDYVLDAGGNKIKDPKQKGIVVPYFYYDSYGIKVNTTVVEIYRPAKRIEEPVYFAFGGIQPILNPAKDTRAHGSTDGVDQQWNPDGTLKQPATGQFTCGDAYLRFRAMYNFFPVESFEYTDNFDSEAISIGVANIENRTMRRQQFFSNLRHGGRYIENTQINDISKFIYDDFIALPQKYGAIGYIKEIDFTLKVYQLYKSASIYIGRQGLTQADVGRSDVLFASNNTLGTVTLSASNYGTSHPYSCYHHERGIYGYDLNSGVIWRDSGNGIRAISQMEDGDTSVPYKIKVFTQSRARTFQQNGVKVFTAYDGRYDIVYFCFADQTDASKSYTIGFHEPSNRWVSFYSFLPEFITSMNQSVLSWRYGKLWLHNEGTRMNFYGQQFSSSVKVVSNVQPTVKKRFLAIVQHATAVWNLASQGDVYIPPNDTYARGQSSLLKAGSFRSIEGSLYAPLGKNMITHQVAPTNDDYINGDDMRGEWIELTLRNSSTDDVTLFAVEVSSVQSSP